MSTMQINPTLLALARRQVALESGKSAAVDASALMGGGMPPGGDPAAAGGAMPPGGAAPPGGAMPPGGDPMAAGGVAAPPPELAAVLPSAQMMGQGDPAAGGQPGAKGKGAKGKEDLSMLKRLLFHFAAQTAGVDVPPAIMAGEDTESLKKLVTILMEAHGIQVPASLILGEEMLGMGAAPQDPAAQGQGQPPAPGQDPAAAGQDPAMQQGLGMVPPMQEMAAPTAKQGELSDDSRLIDAGVPHLPADYDSSKAASLAQRASALLRVLQNNRQQAV